MATQPEARIAARILSYLRSLPNSWWIKTHGGAYGRRGIPDLIGCIHGRFYALEIKRPGQKARPLQEHVLNEIADAGGIVAVVTSKEDVKGIVCGSIQGCSDSSPTDR